MFPRAMLLLNENNFYNFLTDENRIQSMNIKIREKSQEIFPLESIRGREKKVYIHIYFITFKYINENTLHYDI